MQELVVTFVVLATLAVCGLAFYGAVTLSLARAGVRAASPRERRVSIAALALFGAGTAVFLWGALVEPTRLEVTTHAVETAKLPLGTRLRIAHVSDLHVGVGSPAADEVARAINERGVDLLVFTGDAVNAESLTPVFQRVIHDVVAPLGRFGVRGNHDRRLDMGARLAELRGEPVPLLDGRVVLCGASFFDKRAVAPCVARAGAAFTIVAFHSPDLVEALAEGGAAPDLYVAGHTHGGQVRLPLYGAAMTMSAFGKKYEMGRYQVGPTTLYVNRGVGVSPLPAPPIRLLCRPEVALIDVVGTGAAN